MNNNFNDYDYAQTPYYSVQPSSREERLNTYGVRKKNIVICFLLLFVTFGLYGIYWLCTVNDDTKRLVRDSNAPSGITVILLSIITCGIYGIYWTYKLGQRIDYIKGNPNGASGIIFILLDLTAIGGLVIMGIVQSTINNEARY